MYVSLPIFRGLDARGGKNYEWAHAHTCGTTTVTTIIMKSTKVQTLGRNIGTFGLETNLHAYVLGIYRTSFQHNLHCFIDACVHVVNDYIVSN